MIVPKSIKRVVIVIIGILYYTTSQASNKDSLQIISLLDSCKAYYLTDITKARKFIDEAEQRLNKNPRVYLQGKVLYFRGLVLQREKKVSEALSSLEEAKVLFEKHPDTLSLLTTIYRIGAIHLGQGEIVKANDLFTKTYNIAVDIKDSTKMATYLLALAVCQKRMSNIDQAYSMQRDAYNLFKAVGNRGAMSSCLINMAIVEKDRKNFDNALEIYSEALKIIKSLKTIDTQRLAYVYSNRANLYNQQNQFVKGLQDGLNALELFQKSGTSVELMHTYTNLAASSAELERYETAIRYLKKAQALSKDNIEKQQQISKTLSDVYFKQGNNKNAYQALMQSYQLKDSIFTAENAANINELAQQYEADKKDYEIKILNSEKDLSLSKLKNTRLLLTTALLGLIMLGGLIWWLYQVSKKLRTTNQEKDTLLKEIHHRVKNNLQVISALLSLQSRYIKDDTAINALKQGHDRVESMALIHRDLYQHDNLKGVNTKEYLEQLVENLTESYNISEDSIALTFDIDDIWLDVDTMIPMGLMINELISNALKHAFADSKEASLTIKLKDKGDHLQLHIADNGKGVDNIQSMQENSFGYSLIDSFAKKLKADITYQSNDGFAIDMKIHNFQKAA